MGVLRNLRRLHSDRKGAMAIVLAMVLPALAGFMSLGVETGLWFAQRRQLQTVADAAALAGAYEVKNGRTTYIASSATADAARNSFTASGTSTLTVNHPPSSGTYSGNSQAVEVVVSAEPTLLFSKLFLSDLKVTARAVAKATTSTGEACVLALNTAAADTAYFTGSADITLKNCGVAANSDSNQALAVSGSATLTADFIETVGNYTVSGSGKLTVNQALTGVSAITDPFSSLTVPSHSSCTYNNVTAKNTTTLSPGTYCGGLTVNANANVTLNPGTYVIDGSSFSINGQATVTGSGVTIILTDRNGSYSQLQINGGATVNISAPTSGTYKGVAFMGDPNAGFMVQKFNGGSTMNINGAVYFPTQEVDFTGGNNAATSCLRLIANTVKFTGNANMGNNCTSYGLPSTASSQPPKIVE